MWWKIADEKADRKLQFLTNKYLRLYLQSLLISHSCTKCYSTKYFVIFKGSCISRNISRNLSWLHQYKQKICQSKPQALSSGAFWVHSQTLFLMCFWTYIKLSFQWGAIRLYLKKLIICPFFVRAPGYQWPVAP